MTRLPWLTVLFATACLEHAASPPPPPPVPAAACAPPVGAPGLTILACGFAPVVAVAGGDGHAIYALSGAGSYYRIDRAAPATTRLFRTVYTINDPAYDGVAVTGGRLYFPYFEQVGDGISPAVVSIDGTAPTAGAPTVVARPSQEVPGTPMFVDGDHLIAASTHEENFSTSSGGVVRVDLPSGRITRLTPDFGEPVAVASGFVYYTHDAQLERIAIAGGAPTPLVPAIATSARGGQAIDATTIFTALASDPYTIVRLPAAGGAPTPVITLSHGDVEVPLGPPTDLRLVGDALYYRQDQQLLRLRLGASPLAPEVIGPADRPPVVIDGSVFVAFARGGYDEPREGVVAVVAP